jgi:hypothetical protein
LTEIERLEQEKMELDELAQEQQAAITEIEDEKQRKNKENMVFYSLHKQKTQTICTERNKALNKKKKILKITTNKITRNL